ncbi:RagB/SusD family nutrient uptake outer membrane protein [Hymenobacter sp. HMF4947]|uniref:RagB/SusD family nutrient uptake outer membrane protein n=1 Tax=Hymenobacter ginkgonis TaxID=2682976 RepID=A0A7K1T9J0_9BACT|nr:RagB/SusD family nutrient uptake outer membrane protein [Hymenobacter ginkgonis]MVN74962.1 RagB/SusD family nutrient uptake outer membrane protein [Hymenobacter ginkgonis]
MRLKSNFAAAGLVGLLGLTTLATTSCNKDFIDLNDPTRVPTSETYQDSLSIATGVVAAYSTLQDIYGKLNTNIGLFAFTEVPSDNSYSVVDGQGVGEFEYFTYTSGNGRIQSQWAATYRAVARCNVILSRAPAVKLTAATRNRYLAEVKFIRALAYFDAVQIWGDIPLVTGEIATISDAYTFGRTPAATVYAQIEKDLMEAQADLPVSYTSANDLGRVTKGAARGLLGKVYLTEKKYALAESTLRSFLTDYDNTTYKLQPNYADIFLTTNEVNSEIIFAVRYSKGGLGVGSPFTNFFAPTSAQSGGSGASQYNSARQDLLDAFKASGTADTRAVASYGGPVTVTGQPTYYTKKYMDVPTTTGDGENDWIVLRHADVLLMYAEVLNELARPTEAVPYLNRVRTRAGLAGVATTLSQADLRLQIEKDRRLELNFEGHRWFDLLRTGRALSVINAHFATYQIKVGASVVQLQPFQLLFPLPIQEIQTNPVLTQNPGYN